MSIRAVCTAAVWLGALGAASANGQTPAASPAPFVDRPGGPDRPQFSAGSAGPYAVSPLDEPHLAPGAEWDRLPADSPGWFGAVSVALVRPHVSGSLTGGPGLPFAALDWTATPRVEVGYRPDGGGDDLRFGYHWLGASGSDASAPGGLSTRVKMNALDLDYVSREWLAEATSDLCRDLWVVAGLRLADATVRASAALWYFHSEFCGAGPRLGLEWHTPVASAWPVEAYMRAEGTGLVGQTRQTIGFMPAGPRQWNGAAAVLTEVGIGWRPMGPDRFRLDVGFQLEHWWNLGRTDAASAELAVHGIFLRADWRY
ncbi:MAG TPA: hypothetical protein VKE40_06110 [Gemmataceae bacterium]|nr:hypothetical protein [Gemmataceae bacterium]